MRYADGTSYQQYHSDGKLHRDGGPAYVEKCANGTVIEDWYRNGMRDRADVPAYVVRSADGSTRGEYYTKGEFVKNECLPSPLPQFAPLSVIPGVVIRRGSTAPAP